MPRPKGSKNKKNIILSPAEIQEQIDLKLEEIEDLSSDLKEKKSLLKQLQKDLVAAKKAAEMKKINEDMNALLAAIEASDKSVDEIIKILMG